MTNKIAYLLRLATAVLAFSGPALSACNNSIGGFSGAVGNTPPNPSEDIFKVLGTVGTPFSLTVSDSRSTWVVGGNIPLEVAIVNNLPADLLTAQKLSNDHNLLSLEVVRGYTVVNHSSTTQPFGIASIETGGALNQTPPAADPDLRINVIAPFGELFSGLVEDSKTGFTVQERVPAVFLFDSPDGAVDGQFTQKQNKGSFEINMTLNGEVVATASGGPTVIIKQP
ncbi:MAG TPA: hypothetical protein VEC38_00185 [Candidatus Binataceae bacterium]|nr:hypothetical protein [Candidatus Binataceae bacterium]